MKQKVTIKVEMECEDCRNKALKIASMIKGVSSVAIEGDSKDKVVVTGEDVDTVCLGRMLRKKFRSVKVLTVEEVKPKKDDDKDKDKPKVTTVCVMPVGHPKCCCGGGGGGCKCDGACKPCSKCESIKCDGTCKACLRCYSHKCSGQCPPPVICYGQCPPWLSCPSCCSKPSPGLCYTVVYDTPKPADSCTIQ